MVTIETLSISLPASPRSTCAAPTMPSEDYIDIAKNLAPEPIHAEGRSDDASHP